MPNIKVYSSSIEDCYMQRPMLGIVNDSEWIRHSQFYGLREFIIYQRKLIIHKKNIHKQKCIDVIKKVLENPWAF